MAHWTQYLRSLFRPRPSPETVGSPAPKQRVYYSARLDLMGPVGDIGHSFTATLRGSFYSDYTPVRATVQFWDYDGRLVHEEVGLISKTVSYTDAQYEAWNQQRSSLQRGLENVYPYIYGDGNAPTPGSKQ
jgi:hypothetical protein